MEPAILLATQLIYCMVLVVQSMQTTTAHSVLLVLAASAVTLQCKVEPSLQMFTAH